MILYLFFSSKFGCISESLNDKLSSLIINLLPLGDVAVIQMWNFKHMLGIGILSIQHYHDYLEWMTEELIDGQSTLGQVMAWCCLATSHYLTHGWPRCMLPDDITRPQRVNGQATGKVGLARCMILARTEYDHKVPVLPSPVGYIRWQKD